jgi:hypothetical protein
MTQDNSAYFTTDWNREDVSKLANWPSDDE